MKVAIFFIKFATLLATRFMLIGIKIPIVSFSISFLFFLFPLNFFFLPKLLYLDPNAFRFNKSTVKRELYGNEIFIPYTLQKKIH